MSHEDEYLSVEELIEIQKEETRDIIAALLEDGSDPDSLYEIEHHLFAEDFDTLEKAVVEAFKMGFEVLEAEEFFSKGQKGSSAMPHKRNPVLTENLTGLSRLVRMAVIPAMENVTLWHERDISHSSVERNIGPDATVTLDFALARLTSVIKNLVVYPENMMKNMNKFQGLIMSQRVLLALTQAGLSREDAYRLVQRNAMKVWEEGKDFKSELKNDPEVKKVLANEEIDEQFDLEYHTKHVDTIFQRVFSD